ADKQYREATIFAADCIRENGASERTVGPPLKEKVEKLKKEGDLAGALSLIGEVRAMRPQLQPVYLDAILELEREIREQSRPGRGSTTTGPSASIGAHGSLTLRRDAESAVMNELLQS